MNMMMIGALCAAAVTMASGAGFTGYTVDRVVLGNGNIQYKVYANFNDTGLPAGQTWVFLNAYSHATISGTMNAVHRDSFTADGEVGTWQAGSNVSAADRDFDSWVTASGLATSSGWGTALDPGFTNGGTVGDINAGAGWYDASPGTANSVTGGRMLLAQVVRTAASDASVYVGSFAITYKVSGTTTPIQPGQFQYTIGVPCMGGLDCNDNGNNDTCDIVSGSSTDLDGDGVPDECQSDCNGNDVPDLHEIATGIVPDCNSDGIPDDCQGGQAVALLSPDLGAPSGSTPATVTFTDLIPTASLVQLTVRAIGDLSGANEYIDIMLNGSSATRLFVTGASDCPTVPDVALVQLQPDDFNAMVAADGSLHLLFSCPITVDGTECKSGGLTVEMEYLGVPPAGDCNGNMRLDVCEIADGLAADCNGNMRPDSCDIASGFSQDCNANGVPDLCDIATGAAPDCNSNGVLDECDVAAGTSEDIDGNAKPDECQTVSVPAQVATIQAAIDAAPTNEMRIVLVAPGTYAGPIDLKGKPIRLVGTGGASVTTLNGTSGQPHSVLRAISGEPAISLIKGFTITGGMSGTPLPTLPSARCGGGLLLVDAMTSVDQCVFTGNQAPYGGGAYFRFHEGTISNCTFTTNTSQAYGGGLQLYCSSTTVSQCTFTNNIAITAGAGLHIVGSTPTLAQCNLGGNRCYEQGGGISWDPADAVSHLTLNQCSITNNIADTIGGGVYIYPNGGASETQLIGTTVCGNSVRNVVGLYQADASSQVCDCFADLNYDTVVNGVDLAFVLSNWGSSGSAGDITGDGTVNGSDLGMVLAAWGNCASN